MRRLLSIFFVWILAAPPSFAAITAATAWEIRTGGSEANGGGFDASLGGVDYSRQNAAQHAYTDIVIDGSDNTKITSAARPFTPNDAGNIINVTAGTGFTVQRIQILSVDGSNVATCDKAVGTTGSTGGTGNFGGGLTLPVATAPVIVSLVVPGNTIYITGSYSRSASMTVGVNGTSGLPINWIGYTSDRADGGKATITATAGSVILINANGHLNNFRNLNLNCASQSATRGLGLNGNYAEADNIEAYACANRAFYLQAASVRLTNSVARNNPTQPAVEVATGTAYLSGVVARDNTVTGFLLSFGSAVFDRCASLNNTGGSSDGFANTNTGALLFLVSQSLAHGNGRHGVNATTAAAMDGTTIRGSLLTSNVSCGINSAVTNWTTARGAVARNGFWNNGTNRCRVVAGVGDVELAAGANPFVDSASGDFRLNSTASAGAVLRAAGWPGLLPYGGTGYLDIGPLQHEDSGTPSSTPTSYPILQ